MSEPIKVLRLNKVASELGRSVEVIVDFLHKKGFSQYQKDKPNDKVSPEAHDVLLLEFSTDKALKEQAEKRMEDKVVTKEVVTAPEKKVQTVTEKEDDNLDEILEKIKTESVENELKASKKKAAEKAAPVVEAPKAEAPKKEEEVAPVVEKEVAETPVPEAEGEVKPLLKTKLKGPKEVGKIELSDDNSTRPKSKKTKKDADEEAEKDEKAKKKTATSKSKTTDTPPVMEEKPKVEIKAPVVEVKEAKDKKIVHQTIGSALGNNVLEKREEGVLTETKYVTLTGPKVQGKIEIPTERDKKSAADKKEKRKRVKKSNYVAGSDNTTFRPAPGTDNKAPANKTAPNTGNGPGNRRDKRKRPGNEFTSKEVQDTLKQTLNKMGGGGLPGGDRSKLRRLKRDAHAERSEKERMLQEEESSTLKVTEFVSANDLATMMDVPVTEVISACMTLGMMVSINQRLDAEMITIVAEEFGYKVEFVGADDTEAIDDEEDIADLPEQLKERAPIVTIMGHVDHGKTSLLDFIRNSNVVAGEAGGITQHLGAYEVTLPNKKKIAFIDTPGHEAFTAMRARGAKVTDIVIIVVAADDAVMPQTREAISHAQAAGVPIVFAFNKMDKEGANPEKIREQLASMNILVEEWGGKYQTQEISAKKGLNVDKLLEKVLIEADMLQLKANPDKPAIGTILEATMEKGRGIVASLMVQEGTLRRGDTMLAGQFASKVRAMFNERGATITEAGPSTPVKVLGFSGAPQSGDKFKVYEDEDAAKEIANKRQQLLREQGIRTKKHITLDEIGRRLAIGNFKELKLIVKADVDGSVQALTDSFLKLSSNEIQINVIHKGVGQISEGDVMLASASDAIIIGFQVRPSGQARKLAEAESIDIKFYSIIYDAINDVKAAMEGMLAPTTEEKIICNVEIREVFNITKVGRIAGCYVLDGKIERKTKIRIIRDGVVIHTGELASLKRFKDDVKEVASGYECGLNINNFNDIQVGDIIEGYEIIETKRKLA